MEYVAVQGDMWDSISYKFYGSEYYVSNLMLANPDYINTVVFDGGEVLSIPALSTQDTTVLPPWRISS